jgi:hypothetical protein
MKNQEGRFTCPGKGVASVIAIGVVALVAASVMTAAIFESQISQSEIYKRFARETSFLSTINALEFEKLAFRQGVQYSVDHAASDVLSAGGFCKIKVGDTYCNGPCFMPTGVPTNWCVPWWKVYGQTYAPMYQTTEVSLGIRRPDPSDGSYLGYLSGKTAGYFNNYSSALSGPTYCPMPPGFVELSQSSAGGVTASIGSTGGEPIEKKTTFQTSDKKDSITVTEHNVFFQDTYHSSALRVFQFAQDNFVTNDYMKSVFQTASDTGMTNPLCKQSAPIGDVCAGAQAASICEPLLASGCNKQDAAGTDPCNSNKDGIVTADEQYNCTVGQNLKNELTDTAAGGAVKASISVGCYKAGHTDNLIGNPTITVSWKDTGDTSASCTAIKSAYGGSGCGCADACTGSEPECAGCMPASGSGTCPNPSSYPSCPESCCAGTWSCSEHTADCPPIVTTTCTPATCSDTTSCGGCTADYSSCNVAAGCQGSCCSANYDSEGQLASCSRFCGCLPCCKESCVTTSTPDPNCVPSTSHTISVDSCKANACYSCCKSTNALVKNAKCEFDYWATANASVSVVDTLKSYPVADGWLQMALKFFVATGNNPQCNSVVAAESSAFVDSASCCQAITTNAADATAGCKA